MTALARSASFPRRPLLLFGLGALAWIVETALVRTNLEGFSAVYLPVFAGTAIVGAGVALLGEIAWPRLQYTLGWAAAAALVLSLAAPITSGFAHAAWGALLGVGCVAPGPLFPIAWSAAGRGAGGALAGVFVGRIIVSLGAPEWTAYAFTTLGIGLALTQGHGERLAAAVMEEMAAIRRSGNADLVARAESLLSIATRALDELDAVEEATGGAPSEERGAIGALTRQALGLVRRLAGLPASATDLGERIEAALRAREKDLESRYRRELDRILDASPLS